MTSVAHPHPLLSPNVFTDGLPASQVYPLRVAYDAQAFLAPNGGTGKGVQLRNLLGPYADTFVGFAAKGKNHSLQPIIQEGLASYQLWQQISLPFLLHKWRADFFLAPYNIAPLFIPRRTKLILVLHDLILLDRFDVPGLRQRLNNEFRRFLIPKAVSRAHVVLTVSSFVRKQILERFPSTRVEVIPCSIARSWFVESNVRGLDQREDYILAVTSSAPHKNAKRALEAYAAFVATSDRPTVPRLRVVGLSDCENFYRAMARKYQVGDLVEFEPYVTESQLQELYRRARVVMVPSLAEGFGIPVLEAMASGTPVICSNTTSLPEVGGEAASYFDPNDLIAMATTLQAVLSDQNRRRKMVELGIVRAGAFHPKAINVLVQNFWNELQADLPLSSERIRMPNVGE
jgi:glycosyltransferase involved in cell wall biosynthesis